MELDEEKVNSNPAYIQEYNNILTEIEQQNDTTVNLLINKISDLGNEILSMNIDEGNRYIKFLAGAIWFIILKICIHFMKTFNKKVKKLKNLEL